MKIGVIAVPCLTCCLGIGTASASTRFPANGISYAKRNCYKKRGLVILALLFSVIISQYAYASSLKTIVFMADGYDAIMPFNDRDNVIIVVNDGLYGLIDLSGRIVLKPEFAEIKTFSEGFAAAMNEGAWGYINERGEVVIDFSYDSAGMFIDGLAVVEKGGKAGAIDRDGRTRIPFIYTSLGNPGQGLYAASRDGKYGYVNRMGGEVISFVYDGANEFSEGYAAVRKGEKWGIVDKTGRLLVDYTGDYIGVFYRGYAEIVIDGKHGIVDRFGVITPLDESVGISETDNLPLRIFEENGKKGVLDKHDKIIVPAKFEDAIVFGSRHIALSESGKYGLYRLTEVGGNITFDKPEGIAVMLDGVYVAFDQKPVIENDRVLAPVRQICETLCAEMTYDELFTVIVVKKDDITIVFNMNSSIAYVNGEERRLECRVRIIGGRTYVPVRFVADAFGYITSWDADSETVTINLS